MPYLTSTDAPTFLKKGLYYIPWMFLFFRLIIWYLFRESVPSRRLLRHVDFPQSFSRNIGELCIPRKGPILAQSIPRTPGHQTPFSICLYVSRGKSLKKISKIKVTKSNGKVKKSQKKSHVKSHKVKNSRTHFLSDLPLGMYDIWRRRTARRQRCQSL